MTYLTRILLSFALVGVMFLFDAGSGLGPDGAWAQTATKLKCKRCVGSRQLKKGAIKGSRLKNEAVGTGKLSTSLQTHVSERESFYVTLDGNGSSATIGTHGPLSYFARCLLDVPDGGGGFDDIIEIVVTSSVAGWFEEDESDDNFDKPPLAAGFEAIVATETADANARRFDDISESAAVAPGGFYLALGREMTGVGHNILGHDCIVTGNLTKITGTP